MTIRRRRVPREVNARRSTLAKIIILPPSICRPLKAFAVMYTGSKKERIKGPRLHRLACTPCEGLDRLRHVTLLWLLRVNRLTAADVAVQIRASTPPHVVMPQLALHVYVVQW